MITRDRICTVVTLAAVAATFAPAAQAAATTITGTDGGKDSWNIESNWDAGVPSEMWKRRCCRQMRRHH